MLSSCCRHSAFCVMFSPALVMCLCPGIHLTKQEREKERERKANSFPYCYHDFMCVYLLILILVAKLVCEQ